jgi:2-phospho-L-lactate transferase/gluconeogenesis factor (CofD/UPF0052 family)
MVSRDLSVSIATRVHIANFMAQANESLGLIVSGHIQRVYEHAGASIFDYALVNTGPISAALRAHYASAGAESTIAGIEATGRRCATGDFVERDNSLRHASDSVTEADACTARIGATKRR